jgi:ubiquinone/menaquinone biosynthesis C-methylase UbiE
MKKITSPRVVDFYMNAHENDTSDKTYPNLMLVRSFSFLMKKNGKKVLDYGCGYGCNTIFMLSKNVDVTYADTSPYAIEKTTNKINNIEGVESLYCPEVINKDAQKLPFDDESFDVIVCASVLSLLSDKETITELLLEFSRVLKPSGKVYLDINGKDSEFVFYATELDKNQYEYFGKNKKSSTLIAYCPQSVNEFISIVSPIFEILHSGFSQHALFGFKEHEYIVIGQKK